MEELQRQIDLNMVLLTINGLQNKTWAIGDNLEISFG